jgi:hypothetical protein
MQDSFAPTARTRLHRLPARGSYDRAAVAAILDEARICHVGFVADGQPFVIPTIHARFGDELVFHGAKASRLLRAMAGPVCVTVTLLDGLVLARSTFHHSMNYRSVVVLGVAEEITDPERVCAINGPKAPPGPSHLFRLDLREVSTVGLNEARDGIVIDVWTPERGVRTIKRS